MRNFGWRRFGRGAVAVALALAVWSPAVAQQPGVEVKLLEPGAEPRQTLRYKFAAGPAEQVEMDMTMSMAMQMGPIQQPRMQLPTMRMHMKVVPEKVSPEGDLTHSYVLEKVEVLPDPDAMPALVEALRGEMKNIEGLSGTGVVSNQGFIKDADIKLPPNPSQQLKQLSDNLKQSMRQMAAPLPTEAVGKGAKWKVTSNIKTDALTMKQEAVYTLVELNGDTGTFDVVLEQSAPPQNMASPGMPPGTTVQLTSMTGSGKGRTHFDLKKVIPKGEVDATMKMAMEVDAGGQKQPMGMEMGLKTSIKPAGK